jgi:4-alpha-glucanotransferase
MVATLPLLSAFLAEPFIPSPYSPASRLFWNEIYLDVCRLPELAGCPSAQAILSSREFRVELRELRASSLVDYRRVMAAKRKVLEELARSFFAVANSRQEAFRQFLSEHPALEDYALFRAAGEKTRCPWPEWPKPLQDGVVVDYLHQRRAKRPQFHPPERFDAREYGGSGQGNMGGVQAAPMPLHGRPYTLTLAVPPSSAVFFNSASP